MFFPQTRVAIRSRGRLPAGWRKGNSLAIVRAVLLVERYSSHSLYITRVDSKGYAWIRLCKGHPYGNEHGWARLHRYLVERRIGRRLRAWEHVHHVAGASKSTTNIRELEILEACEHGRNHYGQRQLCGKHLPAWTPRDWRGRFTKLPTNESMRASVEAAHLEEYG